MVTGYFEGADGKEQYQSGDKLRIIANVIIEENGLISLNGHYKKITKLDEDAAIYQTLNRSVSPGKVYVIFFGKLKECF